MRSNVLYEKGVVVVNPDSEARTVEIPLKTKGAAFVDIFTGKTLDAENGRLKIAVPANAGGTAVLGTDP